MLVNSLHIILLHHKSLQNYHIMKNNFLPSVSVIFTLYHPTLMKFWPDIKIILSDSCHGRY